MSTHKTGPMAKYTTLDSGDGIEFRPIQPCPARRQRLAITETSVFIRHTDQMPFGLKLIASSALFLGVAFFVALCELFWLHTRDRLAHVRELIAEADLIISKYAEADEAKVQAIQAEQRFRMTQDEDYKKTFAHAKLVEAEQGWRNSIEGQRPDTTNIAKLPPEQYQRRKVFTGKIEAAVIAVDAMKKNQGQQVQDLIERFMAKPASKKLKPESVNQTQAPQNKG